MRKQAEQRKTEILRQLQDKQLKPKPSNVLEAEEVIAKFNQGERDRMAQILRAQSPLPPGDTYPDCFVKRGVTSHMKPIPSDNESDLFKCKECGLTIEINP